MSREELWWQRAVIYQIYPRSFQDTNGDGIGDLNGITRRLDYLAWLGINAIWLSPIFPSPMADFGYDVADFTGVDPVFGTLADFDCLLAKAHQLDLKVLLDFVPNHTSDRHSWFINSRRSRSSPYRDWYLWRDPAPGGGLPNNWLSSFGGSAWQWDEISGQYYLHSYLSEQPDLNWRNPAVESAMCEVLRFWLRRGVDGFRLDAISRLIKDAEFRDNPVDPEYVESGGPYCRLLPVFSRDLPELKEVLRRLRNVVDEFDHRVLIGEAYLTLERLFHYYDYGIHLPFNFQLIKLPWNSRTIGRAIEDYDKGLTATQWPNWVLGNHDKHRVASRLGRAQARVAAMLLLTLRGTPTLYYGDEIGMRDVVVAPESVQDPWERNVPGLGLGRDPERSPMQWSAEPGGGFTQGEPWLPMGEDCKDFNVESEKRNTGSFLNLYRELIALRSTEPALLHGTYEPLFVDDRVLAYRRCLTEKTFAILLNFSSAACSVSNPGPAQVCLSTREDRRLERVEPGWTLQGNEGVILK